MILDNLSAAGQYASMHPLFEKAFNFLNSAANLVDGRYEIQGEDLFATIVSAPMRDEKEASLEAHDNYIDIQLSLSGGETFGWAPREICVPKGAFDKGSDIGFYSNVAQTLIRLEEDQFLIFFPSDAHAPLIGEGVTRKVIMKVRSTL